MSKIKLPSEMFDALRARFSPEGFEAVEVNSGRLWVNEIPCPLCKQGCSNCVCILHFGSHCEDLLRRRCGDRPRTVELTVDSVKIKIRSSSEETPAWEWIREVREFIEAVFEPIEEESDGEDADSESGL